MYALAQWHAIRRATNAAHPRATKSALQSQTNPLTSNSFYADVGRLKWHFMRRLVNIWVEFQDDAALTAFNFSMPVIQAMREQVRNGQTFHIPKRIHGLRKRAGLVKAVLTPPNTDFNYIDRNPQPGFYVHFGLPESLHGTDADGSFCSIRACPE